MPKIKIKAKIKNKNEIHTFTGKGILTENGLTYKDKESLTKITLNPLKIERISSSTIEINLKEGKTCEAIYKTKYGVIHLESKLLELKQEKRKLYIKYILIQNKVIVDTFEYNLEYSIDS